MSGTKQFVARTSPRLVELGKPNLNVAEEPRNASRHTSCESSLEPEKAPSASRGRGRGTNLKSNRTLVRSTSLPARGKTLSGLPSVPEDASVSQPDLPGHYASLDPSEGAEDTPTGTPNPSGGGGPGGGDGDSGDGGGPPGGGPPPPGGGPPGGGPDPNPNPGPNPDPGDGDGGGPPDDDGDHSSDDAEDEALNRSYKDNLAIIAKHVVDKDGGNIKVRVPDTFKGNKRAFRSEANQATFAISYLRGTALDHFKPYILGEIPEAQMMTSWALFRAFLTESFSVLYPEDEAEEQLVLVIFPEDGKASTFFASFEKWKTRTNFSDRSYRRKVLKLIPKCLKKDITRVMPKPQTYSEAKAYILQFDQCHWEDSREAAAEAKLRSHPLRGAKAPANMTSAGSSSTPKSFKKSKTSSSYQKSNNNTSGESSNSLAHNNNKGKSKPVQKPNDISKLLGADGKLLPAVRQHRFDHGLCLICSLKGHMATDCTRRKPVTGKSANQVVRITEVSEASGSGSKK
ncbi:hypothetical protein M422DRAFT_259313 [Sphaerobolus stellatus SS14]|uniref:CCHC-type domain-containing protein n=1 Tax=Sphaerobolus stellatus (strain SS14) TaxID=990650 RepID=A0A0C9V9D0_SPHS4|nr:hypothetical protein M422DRAFT_259313 [Sphaerobolus stellatus SS14]